MINFFFSSRRRQTRYWRDWSSDVCSSDLDEEIIKLLTEKEKELWEVKLKKLEADRRKTKPNTSTKHKNETYAEVLKKHIHDRLTPRRTGSKKPQPPGTKQREKQKAKNQNEQESQKNNQRRPREPRRTVNGNRRRISFLDKRPPPRRKRRQ